MLGCGNSPDGNRSEAGKDATLSEVRPRRMDHILDRAARFLIAHQDSRDGAWRSENYAALKDGPSLTGLALRALQHSPPSPKRNESLQKGADYLAARARPDTSIDEGEHGLSYPVYAAAGAVFVLSDPAFARHRKARDAWLAYLRKRQLTEALGWQPGDKEYGGWGYSAGLPTKASREPLTESNVSATAFALEALRAAGCSQADPTFARALTFVKRCQNYSDARERRDAAFDDGGFFFIYDDANRNKAGLAGKDSTGRERFASYGSATADGLRSLIACGLPMNHPRVGAAQSWLESRFQPDANPGDFPDDREGRQAGVYFYYAFSSCQALLSLANRPAPSQRGKVLLLAEAMADELMSLQAEDGSWRNPADFYQEDDPILATCLAADALAVCRDMMREKNAPGLRP
jgi:squalene-hopene/tetraprenyl-beta-curcumene cyclase